MIDDRTFLGIVEDEYQDAKEYRDELGKKRKVLLDYYQQKPYGDEEEGRSQYISSDVADVVEGMLPSLLRQFTHSKEVAIFEADNPEHDDEARQKTELANYVFYRQNDGYLVLHNMFKDALLQYTGWVKVSYREITEQSSSRRKGLSQLELEKTRFEEGVTIEEETARVTPEGVVYDIELTRQVTNKKVCYDGIPPEEQLITRNARDFRTPSLIGHESPKRRWELIDMGFPDDLVAGLPARERDKTTEAQARNKAPDKDVETSDPAMDEFDLAELYVMVDKDEDGIAELYQVFKVGNTILQEERWDRHPFACLTPVPIPHRAVGECPASQTADIQLTNSVLGRQALDNIYNTNWNRIVYNDRVNLDDLFTPRPAGGIGVEGEGSVQDALMPLPVINQTDGILSMLEFMDIRREIRTGVTRYNQGLDADTLNKTATGFTGIMEASLQRMDMIANLFAETGVRDLFRLTIQMLSKYQDTAMQVRVTGEPLEIDPSAWRQNLDCRINVGSTAARRVERIGVLQAVLAEQKEARQLGLPVVDSTKMYNAYSALVQEADLDDPDMFWIDPSKPDLLLQFENEFLAEQVEQLSQGNPLAEAEAVKAQAAMAQTAFKEEQATLREQMKIIAETTQQLRDLEAKYTELELKFAEDVEGSRV